MTKSTTQTVLICPLNWGIGHATRCIPIIRELIRQGYKVILGADDRPLAFLQSEFPKLQFICFPGKVIRYPRKRGMALKMFLSLPSIFMGIYREHRQLNKIIEEYHIDIVISDNRFGLWNKRIKSIFITHQINIQVPKPLNIFKPLLLKLNLWFIHKYNQVWIPDFKDEPNLSGELSHHIQIDIPHFYIGPLSRFNKTETKEQQKKTDLLVLISGPEPQRSVFEEIIINELKDYPQKSIVLLGKTESQSKRTIGNISVYSHLPSWELQSLIEQAEIIISRPGYSSLMDFVTLNKRAVFVPTPGQTEQEYLAKKLLIEGYFYSMAQSQFNMNSVLENEPDYKGLHFVNDYRVFNKCIASLASI